MVHRAPRDRPEPTPLRQLGRRLLAVAVMAAAASAVYVLASLSVYGTVSL
jgi:hypothetical protein